ncbi:Leucine-rich repeats and WD repeat domain-containing protein 1 [Actinomortierella ambigua]|nr:Leucine-rich repeats and WD repeat domain-containing protein 1 [Actinomortierella ambigua]
MPVRKRAGGSTRKPAESSPAKKPRTQKNASQSLTTNAPLSKDHAWLHPSLLEDKGYADEMVLSHIIRAHSLATHDGQDDDEQDTAACAFEPTIQAQQKSGDSTTSSDEDDSQRSKIVATCGGNTVCLIDCHLGRILAKYSHVEEEEFHCLAWTTLTQQVEADDRENSNSDDGSKQDHDAEDRQHLVNILAAAGRLGSIKLINPLQNVCYMYLHGHTAEIVQLKFSLNNPEWLYSASADGTIRLWDIGFLNKDETESRCLAKLGGLDSPVTAMAVSEKYLVAGTASGDMARYNIRALERKISTRLSARNGGTGSSSALLQLKPDRIFPNSEEWHESTVDDIVYLPRFSLKSYFGDKQDETRNTKAKAKTKVTSTKKGAATASRKGKTAASNSKSNRRGGRKARESSDEEEDSDESSSDEDDDDDDTEYIFASHESSQGEILIWDVASSTETDAELKTILEWPISESQTKFAFAQNVAVQTSSSSSEERKRLRQNVLVVGSTTGEVLLYNLDIKPKRSRGNIVAQKPARVLSNPMSTQLLRTIAVSEDLSTIVAGDWTNRVLIWKYPSYLDV